MLSPAADKIIDQYFNLPFPGVSGVRCPYYNNARGRQRAQLRVLVGKGSPEDIVEESKIVSIQYRGGLFKKSGELENQNISPEEIRKFLIKNNLGIECSGFVTQVLRPYFLETKNIDFTKKLYVCPPYHVISRLLFRLNPEKNINVKLYTNEKNSTVLIGDKVGFDYSQVRPGDIVTMLETGPLGKRNHILLITDKTDHTISYAHARAWSSEGNFGHGVSRGTITIVRPGESLLTQEWKEKDCVGEKNETFLEAKQAKTLEIRRLKI